MALSFISKYESKTSLSFVLFKDMIFFEFFEFIFIASYLANYVNSKHVIWLLSESVTLFLSSNLIWISFLEERRRAFFMLMACYKTLEYNYSYVGDAIWIFFREEDIFMLFFICIFTTFYLLFFFVFFKFF